MIKTIKLFTKHYFKFPTKRYEISPHGFNEFVELTPNAQKLFVAILNNVKPTPEVVVVELTYKDLGYKSYSNLHRDRQRLINRQFIMFENNQYFINPCMVNPYNRRQWSYLKDLIGMNKTTNINFGILPDK